MKKSAIGSAAAALSVVALVSPAQAMGSSDAYENIQVGVTYTVYEPSFTAGLKATHIGGNDLCQAVRPEEGRTLGALNFTYFFSHLGALVQ
jgi:hypothetical protein